MSIKSIHAALLPYRYTLFFIELKEHHTLYELVEDLSFQRYALHPDSQEALRWKQWLADHPEQKELITQAKQMVKGIRFKPTNLPPESIELAWTKVEAQIKKQSSDYFPPYLNFYYVVAASLSLLVLAAASWWSFSASYQMDIQTAYGKTKLVQLSDGSTVTLNANSRLRYDARDMESPARHVELSGEAFFQVVPRKEQERQHTFSVLTEEGGNIEVLGTSFNVQSRRNKIQVVLESGKVKFSVEEIATSMQPGEMVEYSGIYKKVYKKSVQAEMYSAWKEEKLFFDDTSMTALALILEDNYGLKVVFNDESLKSKKITGVISAKNLDTLLKALERLLSISIDQKQQTIYLNPYTT